MENETPNAAYLSYLQLSCNRPITITVPTLYRHMKKEYVEEFFKTGVLRISCFSEFKKHKDELQGDKNEGQSFLVADDKESNRSFGVFVQKGMNEYVLSMSTKQKVDEVFGDAYIEIFEPIGFCAEIANEIPGCIGGMIGQCVYVDNRLLLSSNVKVPTKDDLRDDTEPNKISLNKLLSAGADLYGPKEFFLKELKYQDQAEYRFIWTVNKAAPEPIFVRIHDPKRFCRVVQV